MFSPPSWSQFGTAKSSVPAAALHAFQSKSWPANELTSGWPSTMYCPGRPMYFLSWAATGPVSPAFHQLKSTEMKTLKPTAAAAAYALVSCGSL